MSLSRSLFGALLGLLVSQGVQSAPLQCLYNGANYQPYNQWNRSFIGKAGHGFAFTDACYASVNASGLESVCNWNGMNFSPYSVATGNSIGKIDYGFSHQDACHRVTRADRYGFTCNWNGANYQPYRSYNGEHVGNMDYGFRTLDDCAQATELAVIGSVCNWSGQGYSVYSSQNLHTPDATFRTFQECLNFTSRGGGPTPVPSSEVSLYVNGQTYIDVRAGDVLNYHWRTMNVRSVSSYYTADRGDRCPGGISDEDAARGATKPWVVSVPNEQSSVQAQVLDCQSGVTYTIVLNATLHSGQVRTTSIRVRVW